MTLGSPIGRRSALRRLSTILGGVATVPLASGLLSGCRTPGSASELAAYEYQTLSAPQSDLLAALVDQILPETDTPGAAEAGVPQFIDHMLTDWYAEADRDAFLAELDAIDGQVEGGSFVALDAEAQAAFVAAMDAEAFGPAPDAEAVDDDVAGVAAEGTAAVEDERQNEVAGMQGDLGESMDDEGLDADAEAATELSTGEGTASVGGGATDVPFYRQLKELTVAGYYTSEVGATEELQWVPAPGRYDPDVPVSEIGRAFA